MNKYDFISSVKADSNGKMRAVIANRATGEYHTLRRMFHSWEFFSCWNYALKVISRYELAWLFKLNRGEYEMTKAWKRWIKDHPV